MKKLFLIPFAVVAVCFAIMAITPKDDGVKKLTPEQVQHKDLIDGMLVGEVREKRKFCDSNGHCVECEVPRSESFDFEKFKNEFNSIDQYKAEHRDDCCADFCWASEGCTGC